MFKQNRLIAKLNSIRVAFPVIPVRAEEKTPPPNPEPTGDDKTTPPQSLNLEQVIAQVRQEEKSKLYPRITKAEEQVTALTASINDYIVQVATLKAEIEKLKGSKVDPEEVKNLKAKIELLTAEVETHKNKKPDESAIRAKIEAEFEIKNYIKEKVAENKENIVSLFISDIKGSSKEEVDQSLQKALDNTTKIREELGIAPKVTPTTTEQNNPAFSMNIPPLVNPAVGAQQQQLDIDYIRKLDPKSKEYKEYRQKLGLK